MVSNDTHNKGDLVYVEWIDSAQPQTGWKLFDEWEFGAVVCQSVGWLMQSTDDYITLVGSIGRKNGDLNGEIEQGTGIISIPVVAIKRIRACLVHEP